MSMPKRFRSAGTLAVLATLAVATTFAAREAIGSDHQQTAYTELNPKMDIGDVYVFPGSTDGRVVLAMTVASPMVGNTQAFFDPNALYQFKIDNNQNGVEDLVIQFSFDQLAVGGQTVDVLGPARPRTAPGQDPFRAPFSAGGVKDQFLTTTPTIRRGAAGSMMTGTAGATGTGTAGVTGGTAAQNQIQVFAGLRDDPFFVDLPQFFRIIPDRRPTEGPLSNIHQRLGQATAFRPACNAQGQFQFTTPADSASFDRRAGCATDFLNGFNALAIVIEMPEAALNQGRPAGNTGPIGVWATVSR